MAKVRKAIKAALPKGYEEVAHKGMIVYQVPTKVFTRKGQPLWLGALAAPKSYLTLHLLPAYGSKTALAQLQAGFKKAGKKLDMGKGCIRYHKADDLALDAIGDVIKSMPVKKWVEVATEAWS